MIRTKPTEECMDLEDYIMNLQYKENPMKHTNNDSTDTIYSRITYIMTNIIYFKNNVYFLIFIILLSCNFRYFIE